LRRNPSDMVKVEVLLNHPTGKQAIS